MSYGKEKRGRDKGVVEGERERGNKGMELGL